MRATLLILFLTITQIAFAQKIVRGIIIDKEKQLPISRASVFLNNTSVGTVSDDAGRFTLRLPQGKFELIVSSIGYESYLLIVSSSDEANDFTIEMKLKDETLEEVIITPYDKDGWKNWGSFFLQHFIGTRAEASDCKIKNTDVLRFRHNKTTGELIVNATEPLVIENKALGYKIIYDLVKFNYSFKTRYLVYSGYPFFEEMEGSESKKKKWQKKRKEVYEGSLMHFMISVYANTLLKEGFQMRRLKKIENTEKTRVKELIRNGRQNALNRTSNSISISDSSKYYNRIMEQDDMINIYGKDILPGDSIAFAFDSVTAGIEFQDHLYILYTKKKTPREFLLQFPRAADAMISELTIIGGKPIEIKSNGMFYDSMDLVSMGYWSWAEKISAMLPFDFD